jgi:hypothetical protein
MKKIEKTILFFIILTIFNTCKKKDVEKQSDVNIENEGELVLELKCNVDSIPNNIPVIFTNYSKGFDSFIWKANGIVFSRDENVQLIYNNFQSYYTGNTTITLIGIKNNIAKDSIERNFKVYNTIEVNFNIPNNIETHTEYEIQNISSGFDIYKWYDNGNLFLETNNSNNFIYKTFTGGVHEIKVIALKSSGFSIQKATSINVKEKYSISNIITRNIPIEGQNIKFSLSSTGFDLGLCSIIWDYGDGYITNSDERVHLYQSNGRYNVNVTITQDTIIRRLFREITICSNRIYSNLFATTDGLGRNKYLKYAAIGGHSFFSTCNFLDSDGLYGYNNCGSDLLPQTFTISQISENEIQLICNSYTKKLTFESPLSNGDNLYFNFKSVEPFFNNTARLIYDVVQNNMIYSCDYDVSGGMINEKESTLLKSL